MMNSRLRAAAVVIIAVAALEPVSAATTTVNFALLNGASSVANGTFSFDASKKGQLSYGDLDTFSFMLPGGSYDLAFTQSGGFSSYYYFGYDATLQTFVTAQVGGFPTVLTAIKPLFSSGYFVSDNTVKVVRNYNPESGNLSYTSLTSTSVTEAVPEPATWAMMIGGFALVAGAMRRRRVNTKVRIGGPALGSTKIGSRGA